MTIPRKLSFFPPFLYSHTFIDLESAFPHHYKTSTHRYDSGPNAAINLHNQEQTYMRIRACEAYARPLYHPCNKTERVSGVCIERKRSIRRYRGPLPSISPK